MTTFQSPLLPGAGSGTLTISLLLAQLISGGLASVIVYAFLAAPAGERLVAWLARSLAWLGLAQSEITRYTAIALSACVSLAAYAVALAFGFVPDPVGAEGWLDLMLALLGVGYTGSQVVHARAKAR